MSERIRRTGDSPYNRRDERGSKGSCLETLTITGAVVAALVALVRRTK